MTHKIENGFRQCYKNQQLFVTLNVSVPFTLSAGETVMLCFCASHLLPTGLQIPGLGSAPWFAVRAFSCPRRLTSAATKVVWVCKTTHVMFPRVNKVTFAKNRLWNHSRAEGFRTPTPRGRITPRSYICKNGCMRGAACMAALARQLICKRSCRGKIVLFYYATSFHI